jgi:hypothetical protein
VQCFLGCENTPDVERSGRALYVNATPAYVHELNERVFLGLGISTHLMTGLGNKYPERELIVTLDIRAGWVLLKLSESLNVAKLLVCLRGLLTVSLLASGCGGRTESGGPSVDDAVLESDGPGVTREIAALCDYIFSLGCSPIASRTDCHLILASERRDAELLGCAVRYDELVACRMRMGARCERGLQIWNSTCNEQQATLEQCG